MTQHDFARSSFCDGFASCRCPLPKPIGLLGIFKRTQNKHRVVNKILHQGNIQLFDLDVI